MKAIDAIKAKVAKVKADVLNSYKEKVKTADIVTRFKLTLSQLSAKLVPVWDACKKIDADLTFLEWVRLFDASIPKVLRADKAKLDKKKTTVTDKWSQEDVDAYLATVQAVSHKLYQHIRYVVYAIPMNEKRSKESAEADKSGAKHETFKPREALVQLLAFVMAHAGLTDWETIDSRLKATVNEVSFKAMSDNARTKLAKNVATEAVKIRKRMDSLRSGEIEKQAEKQASKRSQAAMEASVADGQEAIRATQKAQAEAIKRQKKEQADKIAAGKAAQAAQASKKGSRKSNRSAHANA